MTQADTDLAALRALVDGFFAAFTSGPRLPAQLAELRSMFLDRAVIVRTLGDETTSYDVDSFIEPRRELLESGELLGFREWPVAGRLDVFGDIAQWFGSYQKSGRSAGSPFAGAGMKSIQFARVTGTWRISAVAWCDEREGLTLTDYRQSHSGSAPIVP